MVTEMNQKISDLIQRRRLQLLVHSCIYYELDQNIISDKQWDEWARELVQLQKEYPEESKEVIWYDAFKDWDASTGAFLPIKDEWVVRKSKQLLHWQKQFSDTQIKNLEIPNKPAANKKTGALKLF